MKTPKRATSKATPAPEAPLSKRVTALQTKLDAMPGAAHEPVPLKGFAHVRMYKVMGKLFAILSTRKEEYVIVKCDPHLAEMMREQYAGVGHRSHLDKRFWISIDLDADVPAAETRKLVAQSYDLIRAGLSKKQKAELAALA